MSLSDATAQQSCYCSSQTCTWLWGGIHSWMHWSESGAAHPCSRWMSAVPEMARHLLGENIQEPINPSAINNLSSRGRGRALPDLTSSYWLHLTDLSMESEACTEPFAGSWPSLLEFFLFHWKSYMALQSTAKSRDGDFYAWLTHCQVFKADWNWLGSKANGSGAAGICTKGLNIHLGMWHFSV